jgi:uncharacterized protein
VNTALLVGALLTVASAGALQRVTGIGYALVATPALLVAVGPDEAVRLVTVTSLVTCAITLASTWRHLRWREVAVLLPFAFLAMWPAGELADAVGDATATLLAGIVVLAALVLSLWPRRLEAVPPWAQAVVAGGLSGAMNAVAAIGGPMGAAYGISRRWGTSLVPNLQVLLLLSALGVLAVRGWPARTTDTQVVVLTLAAGLGVVCGGWLSGRIPGRCGSMLTVLVAVVGASVAILRGAAGLAG